MGAWGTGLYQDDVTADIKDEYINRLKLGQSNIEATQELIDYNIDYIEDLEDGPLFWFALADTQWNYGRLLPEVKEKTLQILNSGIDLKRWENNKKQYEKRKVELKKLEDKLNSEQPPEKKVGKLTLKKAAWDVGDVLLYQIQNENEKHSKWYNKYILFRVVGITKTNIGSLPREYSHEQNVITMYNWVGNNPPDLNIINNLTFIKRKNDYDRIEDAMSIHSLTPRELKKVNFEVLFKDSTYQLPSEHTMDTIGKPWYNINNMDYFFIYTLNIAEENNILISETN